LKSKRFFRFFTFFAFGLGQRMHKMARAQSEKFGLKKNQKKMQKNNKKVMYKTLACFVYRALGQFWCFRLFGF